MPTMYGCLSICSDATTWTAGFVTVPHRGRGHIRLIEGFSGLIAADDAEVAMFVHAAKLTDNFWVMRDGECLPS